MVLLGFCWLGSGQAYEEYGDLSVGDSVIGSQGSWLPGQGEA